MKVMVTGAGGQLGRCLTERAAEGVLSSELTLVGFDRHQLDITDADAVNAAFRRIKPGVVINAAAWTSVDGAQLHVDQAMAVNALGAANVAAAAAQYGARMVHISTDYVFDGTARQPIDEAAKPGALNVYGASKLAGEVAVRHEASDAVIVRTSWLYSAHGTNFLKTILQRAMPCRTHTEALSMSSGKQAKDCAQNVLRVVDDQTGCPTSADDLAAAVMQLVQHAELQPGVYHYSGKDAMTWFDFACLIVDHATRYDATWANVCIQRAIAQTRPESAPRPVYSVLSCKKIQALGVPLHGPRDRLESLAAALLATSE